MSITANELPRRAKLRKASADPRWTKSSTLMAEPKRVKDRKLSEEDR
jgi:hypothetical protein